VTWFGSCDWLHLTAFLIGFGFVVLHQNRKHICTLVGHYRSLQAGLQDIATFVGLQKVFTELALHCLSVENSL